MPNIPLGRNQSAPLIQNENQPQGWGDTSAPRNDQDQRTEVVSRFRNAQAALNRIKQAHRNGQTGFAHAELRTAAEGGSFDARLQVAQQIERCSRSGLPPPNRTQKEIVAYLRAGHAWVSACRRDAVFQQQPSATVQDDQYLFLKEVDELDEKLSGKLSPTSTSTKLYGGRPLSPEAIEKRTASIREKLASGDTNAIHELTTLTARLIATNQRDEALTKLKELIPLCKERKSADWEAI